jgi:anthranilate synthase component 1
VLVVSLVDAAGLRDVEGEGFSAAYAGRRRYTQDLGAALGPAGASDAGFRTGEFGISSNFTKARYEEAVEGAKEYIRAGDAFQIVLPRGSPRDRRP